MLLDAAHEHGVHRLTVSGGDPLEQASELVKLLATIRCAYDDILVYTGFTLEELPRAIGADVWETLKPLIDVLIDGPYIDELNVPDCALRGSTNQRVIYLSDRPHDDYDQYLQQPRQLQNYVQDGMIITVGIADRYHHEFSAKEV